MNGTKKLYEISAIVSLVMLLHTPVAKSDELPSITVYKTPTCGCCNKWVAHLEENGFQVKALDMPKLDSIKSISGIKQNFESCHTATVGGYVIEGHVPASDIKRLLSERPVARGLVVPGMPMGSPGMEGAHQDKYQVLTYDNSGITGVFSNH